MEKQEGFVPNQRLAGDSAAEPKNSAPLTEFDLIVSGFVARMIPDAVIFADAPEHVADLRLRAAKVLRPLISALYECEDYFDGLADADYQGEEDGFVGNAEARLLCEVREALGKVNF